MPKSRINKNRKEKVKEYKQVKQIENQLKNQIKMERQQIPEHMKVRTVPKWKSTDTLELNGLEWETIYNTLSNIRAAIVAADSVMNRNIVNGKIQVEFEKLNDAGTDYVTLTGEDEAPYRKQFQEMLDKIKEQGENPQPIEEAQPEQQQAKIVDLEGNPVTSEELAEVEA